jgi:hypothetical protein
LLRKIGDELLVFRDPADGKTVIEAVHAPARSDVAPDLIVGYARGYRASWQTALGAAPEALVEDNRDAWIGDHCINAADVPGVLFSNRKVRVDDPQLRDVTVSILEMFGINAAPGMSGRKIL